VGFAAGRESAILGSRLPYAPGTATGDELTSGSNRDTVNTAARFLGMKSISPKAVMVSEVAERRSLQVFLDDDREHRSGLLA